VLEVPDPRRAEPQQVADGHAVEVYLKQLAE
jgi:hypothetical protein